MDIFVIKDNKVYDVEYYSSQKNYDKYLPRIQKMIDSFKIIDLDLLVYENPTMGFIINYTSDWQPVEDTENNVFRFNSLLSSDSDLQENLAISYSSYQSENITLDKAMNFYITSFKRYQHYDVIEPPHRITIANNYSALKTTVDYVEPNGSYRVMAVLVQDGDYVYQLEYDTTRTDFNLYMTTVQKMIDSFKIMVQFVDYQSLSHEEVNMTYLSNWNVIDRGDEIVFLLPNQSSTDKFRENLSIKILPNLPNEYLTSSSFDEMIHKEVNYYRENFLNLDILESNSLNVGTIPSHKIILNGVDNDTQHKHKVLAIWTIKNDKVYFIKYEAEETNYSHYAASIQTTIGSLINNLLKKKESTISQYSNLPAIEVGLIPLDLAVNPKTNKIYVANSGSNTVSVIDGIRNKVIANVSVGEYPVDVIIDPNEPWIYIPNFDSQTVSVIDYNIDKVVDNISKLGVSPVQIDLNPFTNTLYISNQDTDTVSVVEYFTNQTGGFEYNVVNNIQVGNFDSIGGIAVNKDTNVIYVSLYKSNLIRVINGSTNTIINNNFTSDNGPFDVTINPMTNLVYVANSGSNTVSVINGTKISRIEVGQYPEDIIINPMTNLVYVANSGSNTVSVINARENKVMAGVEFSIHPPNSGYLECNGNKIYNVTHIRYNIDTSNIKCKAIPFKDIAFESWNGSLSSNSRLSWINDFGYMINNLFGSSSSNPVNLPETIINASNSGTVSAVFVKGLNFVQKFGNIISISALIVFVLVPILLALPTSILHKSTKLPSKAFGRLFSFVEDLSKADILQIDASVIVGVLILLSLTGISLNRSQMNIITANIIFPFAISAILTLVNRKHEDNYKVEKMSSESSQVSNISQNSNTLGVKLMVAGFVNLIVSLILLSILGQ
jgi:YVTN family beta-propeller protein